MEEKFNESELDLEDRNFLLDDLINEIEVFENLSNFSCGEFTDENQIPVCEVFMIVSRTGFLLCPVCFYFI